MDKLLFKRILVTILLICLVSYVIYLFTGMYSNGTIETENAVYTSVSDTINADGFVVRNEVLVKNTGDGVISYNVSDGENISVGQNIADIYDSENDAVARREIKELNNQIKDLEKLSKSHFKESVGLDTINSQIEGEIFSLLNNVNYENYSSVNDDGNDLLFYINERQIITGQVKNFDARIEKLKQEKSRIEDSCSPKNGSITAKNAGYFITDIDGYEKTVSYEDVSKVTLDDYKSFSKKDYSGDYVGKIVTDPEWYVMCKINKDDALALSKMQGDGTAVSIQIPSITTEKIPASIVAVNQKTRQDDGLLVLSCDYMNKDISKARIEGIEIETSFQEGLKISKRAIHEDYVTKRVEKKGKVIEKRKKVQGVYVLYGSELIFKEISISYSAKDYVICESLPEEGTLFNGETVQLYDRVVIKGDNLYDGKII